MNRSPSNLGAAASLALLEVEVEFWEIAISSFVDLATGEDAVTRISWSLRAVNEADAAAATAHMIVTGRLIIQFLRKERSGESNPRPDTRKTLLL